MQGDLFNQPVFHETVHLTSSERAEAVSKAATQDVVVYGIFCENPGRSFAWFEVLPLAQARIEIGEVSLKRALSNLKKSGKLLRLRGERVESPAGGMCNKYRLADKINQPDNQAIR